MRRWFRDELEAFVMLFPVPWKRFIAREGLIVLGFIGLGLIIAYMCFRAGGLYYTTDIDVDWKKYESHYFGRPILRFKWIEHRIEKNQPVTIDHIFTFKKPFVPLGREWVYFFAYDDKPGKLRGMENGPYWIYPDNYNYNYYYKLIIPSQSYREKPGAKLGFLLSPKMIDAVEVLMIIPRKFYPFYIRRYIRRYVWKYLILPYAGFWSIRLIVLSVIQLGRREKSSG